MRLEYGTMIERIRDNVHEVDPRAEVWLYGSRARNEHHAESDWDVLVLSPKDELSFEEEELFLDNMCHLMVETGQAIHLFAYGKRDWHTRHSVTPFYQHVEAEAVRL